MSFDDPKGQTIYEAMRRIVVAKWVIRLWLDMPDPSEQNAIELAVVDFPYGKISSVRSAEQAITVIEEWAKANEHPLAAAEVLDRDSHDGAIVYLDWP